MVNYKFENKAPAGFTLRRAIILAAILTFLPCLEADEDASAPLTDVLFSDQG